VPGLDPSSPLPEGCALVFLFAHASHDRRAFALASAVAGLRAWPPLPAAAQGALKREARCVPVVGASPGAVAAALAAAPLLRACLERAWPSEAAFAGEGGAIEWLRARVGDAARADAAAGLPPPRVRARVFPRGAAGAVEARVGGGGGGGGPGRLLFACLARVCGAFHAALVPHGGVWDFPELAEAPPPAICRAQRKLEEAAARVPGLLRGGGDGAPPRGVGVDLGAAPGGWASVLARSLEVVLAVDPAQLVLAALPAGVRHIQQRAEEFLSASPADDAVWAAATCDANVPTHVALAWLEAVLPRLEPGAFFCWTLKNFSGGVRAWREGLAGVEGRVEGWGAEGVETVHLVSNGPAEVTLVGRRKRQ
jgi:hypothetical protein